MAGLEARYNVTKIDDPAGKHNECRYFVLDPEHDYNAYVALGHYADTIEYTDPELFEDLVDWLTDITNNIDANAFADWMKEHNFNSDHVAVVRAGANG